MREDSATMNDEVRGTAVKDEDLGVTLDHEGTRMLTAEQEKVREKANAMVSEAYQLLMDSGVLARPMPTGCVQWVPAEKVVANDYNPNSVAQAEMSLLNTSIREDGYTQPIVTVYDEERGLYVVVDGYHRYTVMRKFPGIWDSTGGLLPIVVIDKPIADRIASTVRHNRARGKHSVDGMSNLVFEMLKDGETDADICNKIGLGAEELARLKHITGFSKLFRQADYSRPIQTSNQVKGKAAYKAAHPDEDVPYF